MVLKRTLGDEETSNPESKRERVQSENQTGRRLFLFHDVVGDTRDPPDPVESGLICYSPETLILGSINGLLCSVGHSRYHSSPSPDDIWIWNPFTRRSKKLPIGNHTYTRFTNVQITFAFCWDEIADVYKIVKMVSKKCEPTKAEVWASNSDSWKDITFNNNIYGPPCFYHPTHLVYLAPATHCDVVVESSPYWVVLDYDENVFAASFDVKTDELKLFPFPDKTHFSDDFLGLVISKKLVVTSYKGCFAVLGLREYIKDPIGGTTQKFDLWTMDHGGQWTKGENPVVFDFYFWFCSNTIDGKFLVLQLQQGINLYNFETKCNRILYGDPRNCNFVGSTFDFLPNNASIPGFEPFGENFCSLINLIWPTDLQNMYPEPPDAPKQQFVLLTKGEMEDDPDELDISAPLWECQNHFKY